MCEKIFDETLNLRINRIKKEFFERERVFLAGNERHEICPFKLKNIPEIIREKFRININDLDNSIKKTMNYLNSNELNEIKFGSFLLRRFFLDLAQLDSKLKEQNQRLDFTIDKFLENNMIEIIGNVLTKGSDIDIISELTNALVNITYFGSENGDYINKFMNKTYMDIFYKLVSFGNNEILDNLYRFFVNCIKENDQFGKYILGDEKFINLCIMKHLEQNKPTKNSELDSKKSAILFFISLSKFANIFTEKQIKTFYKIHERFLGVKVDSEIVLKAICGIRDLFTSDPSKGKIVFNLIKSNKYDIFNKLFISFSVLFIEEKNFLENIVICNIEKIITHFISLAEEKDVIILVKNTQLINFIDYYLPKLSFKNNKNLLWDIIVNLSHHRPNVVLNMIQDRKEFLETIKSHTNDENFDIKVKCIEIVYSMISLNSLDINLILYKNEIIQQLIENNLPLEEDKNCLKHILFSILYFINSIKQLENKIELINFLIKIGMLKGLENKSERFDNEHKKIINEINSDIKMILKNEQNMQFNGEHYNKFFLNNPFLINNDIII